MKALPLSILFLLSFLITFESCSYNKKSKEVTKEQLTGSIESIYTNSCAGCHGEQLQHFKRLKSYEQPVEYLADIIKKGDTQKGMPAFDNALSEKQIQEITVFIKNFDYNSEQLIKAPTNEAYDYEVIVDDLGIPWGFEFLPNGDLLIAEKEGILSRFSKEHGKQLIKGLPPIRTGGQGGLLDIRLHPDFKTNPWIYIAYAYFGNDKETSNTAIVRGKLNDENTLYDIEPIYKGIPATSTTYHFGTRMVFDKEGYLYFANGDRGNRDEFPQQLNNANGKIHRLHADGSIPKDNPFVNQNNSIASIYSYGHRNPQGLAIHPTTGAIWEHEHGPKGGDEINIIQKGKNYGWPIISYGINYNSTSFTDITAKEGMEQPIHYYVPSIAPCGMTFLNSDRYPAWKNNLFIGSLKFRYLERLELNGDQVIFQEKLLEELNSRVRDVRMSPDGFLYVAVENPGRILKILSK